MAAVVDKDPRLIELVLRESTEVLRTVPGVIVVEHNLGLVMANAGIDQSNLRPDDDHGYALLLPEDPDASAGRAPRRPRDPGSASTSPSS